MKDKIELKQKVVGANKTHGYNEFVRVWNVFVFVFNQLDYEEQLKMKKRMLEALEEIKER